MYFEVTFWILTHFFIKIQQKLLIFFRTLPPWPAKDLRAPTPCLTPPDAVDLSFTAPALPAVFVRCSAYTPRCLCALATPLLVSLYYTSLQGISIIIFAAPTDIVFAGPMSVSLSFTCRLPVVVQVYLLYTNCQDDARKLHFVYRFLRFVCDFIRLYKWVRLMQTDTSNNHKKFVTRMWANANANLRRLRLGEEIKIERKKEQRTGWKYIWSALFHRATINQLLCCFRPHRSTTYNT